MPRPRSCWPSACCDPTRRPPTTTARAARVPDRDGRVRVDLRGQPDRGPGRGGPDHRHLRRHEADGGIEHQARRPHPRQPQRAPGDDLPGRRGADDLCHVERGLRARAKRDLVLRRQQRADRHPCDQRCLAVSGGPAGTAALARRAPRRRTPADGRGLGGGRRDLALVGRTGGSTPPTGLGSSAGSESAPSWRAASSPLEWICRPRSPQQIPNKSTDERGRWARVLSLVIRILGVDVRITALGDRGLAADLRRCRVGRTVRPPGPLRGSAFGIVE